MHCAWTEKLKHQYLGCMNALCKPEPLAALGQLYEGLELKLPQSRNAVMFE